MKILIYLICLKQVLHIIWNLGDPLGAIRMLRKIATGRIKKLAFPTDGTYMMVMDGRYNGRLKGSFRWDDKSYTLNDNELEYLNYLLHKYTGYDESGKSLKETIKDNLIDM